MHSYRYVWLACSLPGLLQLCMSKWIDSRRPRVYGVQLSPVKYTQNNDVINEL